MPSRESVAPGRKPRSGTINPRIRLKPYLLQMVRDGRKRATIRRGKRDFCVGPAVLCAGRDEIAIEITRVEHKTIADLTLAHVRASGSESIEQFCATMKRFYKSAISASTVVTVIWFKTFRTRAK